MTARARSPLDAFQGNIRSSPASPLYTLGLFFVAIAMAILPLIYIGLIILTVWAVYWHATQHYGPIFGFTRSMNSRVLMFKGFLYLTPIFVGSILALFMVKPLFARRSAAAQPYALNPENEPLLYEFIQRICKLVGAPPPTRIDLDCHINAAAAFRRGWKSLLGNDLVLVLGIPLVAGLNMRQLAGVIAHEFGHFTQGIAMRLTYIIRSINGWFARVVFERDAWDDFLDEMAEAQEFWIAIAVGFARLGVWFSRRILQLLMMIGHGISCFMLRQMEYDADHYEIQLAGSTAFEQTVERMNLLNHIASGAYKEMRVSWNMNRRLPDNVPAFLLNKERDHGEELLKQMKQKMPHAETRLFDTHPSDADRVRRARLANSPGIFNLERPATELFSNFPVVAKIVTLIHYQDDLGLPVLGPNLVPVPEHYYGQKTTAPATEMDYTSILNQYFFGVSSPLRPIPVADVVVQDSCAALKEMLGIPTQLEAVLEPVKEACARFDAADARCIRSMQAAALLKAGLSIRPADFGLETEPLLEHIDAAYLNAVEEKNRVLFKLEDVIQLLGRRASLALALLQLPELAHFAAREKLDEGLQAARFLSDLAPCLPEIIRLRDEAAALAALLHNQKFGQSDLFKVELASRLQFCRETLALLKEALAFAEEFLPERAQQALVGEVSDDPSQVCTNSSDLVHGLFDWQQALLGQIAFTAQHFEMSLLKNAATGTPVPA